MQDSFEDALAIVKACYEVAKDVDPSLLVTDLYESDLGIDVAILNSALAAKSPWAYIWQARDFGTDLSGQDSTWTKATMRNNHLYVTIDLRQALARSRVILR